VPCIQQGLRERDWLLAKAEFSCRGFPTQYASILVIFGGAICRIPCSLCKGAGGLSASAMACYKIRKNWIPGQALWYNKRSFCLIARLLMPFSQSSQLSSIVQFIEHLNPSSILDVGTGMGQYGFLARNNLEHAGLFEVDGANARQRPKSDWRVRIDGIEAFAGYLTPVHDYVYNNIMIGDALSILPTLKSGAYELVIAVDILEHFTREDGLKFLGELKRVANRAALVSTPKEFHSQEIEANPYENHRSHWSQEDLAASGFRDILANTESWIAVYHNE
jgi:hypothetical protein